MKAKQSKIANSQGQVIVEYILLLGVIVLITFVFMKGINQTIGTMWEGVVNKIVYPSKVQLR